MYVQTILGTKGSKVVTTRPGETIEATSRLLTANKIGAVIVVDEAGKVVGVISERDILGAMAAHGARVTAMLVEELMTRDVLTCRPGDTIAEIMAVMTTRRVRHLPVVEGDKLLGVVSIGDVVKHRLDEAALEVDSMRQYVLSAR
ncbi:MAG: CBS domain-containing protein [Dongiaceae bacterium]